MRYEIYTADGEQIGYVTDAPEFRWELKQHSEFRSAIEDVIRRSEEYEMVVAGGPHEEHALTPPEEDVPVNDFARLVRVASELPLAAPVQVRPADDWDKQHLAEDLTAFVNEEVAEDTEDEDPHIASQRAVRRSLDRMRNERRESVVKVGDLQTPAIDISENKTLRKAGENFILVDDMLMEAFEKQIWEEDMTKAPNMWRRDDDVPQFVRSHVKDAIDKTDALHDDFTNIPHVAALKVHEIIKDQLTDAGGWSIQTVVRALLDEFDEMSEKQAEDIARTEVAAVLNKARELALEAAAMAEAENEAENITGMPEQEALEDFKDDIGYYWAGPEDHRTTNICSETKDEIEDRGGYVPKDELKEILRGKARKYKEEDGGLPERVESFVPHFECRHTFIREDYQRVT